MDLFPEIPGYKIEKKLAGGRISEIYMGVQEDLNRHVAIKVMNPELFNDPKLLDNFLKEAKRNAKFVHPAIIETMDAGEHNGLYYLVQEYLPRSLRTRINRKFGLDGLPPAGKEEKSLLGPQLIHMLREIAWAFDYAHGQGVIHMDVRPENIRFRENGEPVMSGFFMARVIGQSKLLKKRGLVAANHHYISPEQALRKPLDPSSDIYSLGVTLYEALTGKVPYDAEEVIAIENQHIMEPVPSLPNDCAHFQPLLDAMMDKTQEERIQNASQLIQMLDTAALNVPSVPVTPRKSEKKKISQQMPLESGPREFDFSEEVPLEFPSIPDGGSDGDESSFTHHQRSPKAGDEAAMSPPDVLDDDDEMEEDDDDFPTSRSRERITFQKPTPQGFDMDRIKELLFNPKVFIPILAGIVLLVVVVLFFGGGSSGDGAGDGSQQKPLTKEEQAVIDQQYQYKLNMVKKFIKGGEFDTARQRLHEAETFKKTSETEALHKDIETKEALQRDENTFKNALKTNVIADFENYIKEFPSGVHSNEAMEKVEQLKVEARKREEERQRILSAAVKLRSQPKDLSVDEVKVMLKKYNFFEKYYNKNGNFVNHFQIKNKGKAESRELVVVDFSTALMWHQNGSPEYVKIKDAKEWLENLNSQGYAGYSDWRLPTLEETVSLLEKEENIRRLFIDNHFSIEQKFIWTADTIGKHKAWVVDFFSGDVNRVDVDFEAYVRPVRNLTEID